MIIVVMGVSGSGKTTVGQELARQLGWGFVDGDDLHSAANIAAMSQGIPLDDEDRRGWLQAIGSLIRQTNQEGKSLVIACSALKQSYRQGLQGSQIEWVYLRGSPEQIQARLSQRQGHFWDPSLLDSQFEALQEPDQALVLDISDRPEVLVDKICQGLGLRDPAG
ncbi:MAG: gluconokinase [Synechococcaceae cyanobacterium RM1_1_27]|nr:gluconokinase [Synechococcaceae cyanobacterium SM2_3_2]NJO85426.1 gluconokinase [Synechococcaceae cyanobacterium RM1_1_27]